VGWDSAQGSQKLERLFFQFLITEKSIALFMEENSKREAL